MSPPISVLLPPFTMTSPPGTCPPTPTEITTSPLFLAFESPLLREIDPELSDEFPVNSAKLPDWPLDPAVADRMSMPPLDDWEPEPLAI